MALAYAVVFVAEELWLNQRVESTRMAQESADQKFETMAQYNMKALVTRNPEPRVMTYPEMRNAFPGYNLDGIVGLYFTADIS